MTNSSKRLLFLVASITALLLSFAPASFAGENDGPGPTQVGEVQGPAGPQGPPGPAGSSGPQGPAGSQGPEGSAGANGSNGEKGDTGATGAKGESGASGGVLGATHTVASTTQDTAAARGGVQAGFGGMAGESSSLSMTLAFAGGILLLLAAAAGYTPLRRRSQN